jgi:hypothetical protein
MRIGHSTFHSTFLPLALAAVFAAGGQSLLAADSEVLRPVTARFAAGETTEEPSFQRHVSPLFGRLGCNGRSCHGSFQGRGGFRLSLFGYDFQADHDELLKGEPLRANKEKPSQSLIPVKPTEPICTKGPPLQERWLGIHNFLPLARSRGEVR